MSAPNDRNTPRRVEPSRRRRGAAAVGLGVLTAPVVGLVSAAPASAQTWDSSNCTSAVGSSQSPWNRSNAATRVSAYLMLGKEGYEWGGGCYALNGYDDTPNAPDSGGEGNDCSGFVFRMWLFDAANPTNGNWKNYSAGESVHGPYTAYSYAHAISSSPYKNVAKDYGTTDIMDAFASDSHIGLIFTEGSGGSDWIAEAKSDADGTDYFLRSYRDSSAYVGVARKNWA